MKTTLVTAPNYYALSLAGAKEHLRVDHTDDDSYISLLIGAATEKAEEYLCRKLITQTWKVFLDGWPCYDEIVLPFGQLNSITHVKYKDTDGDQTTWDSSTEYLTDTDTDPGRIVLAYGKAFPTATLYPANPIEIQFVCGYGAHTPQTITAATNATPIVATITPHGYSTGDAVYVSGGTTLTAINGLWRITSTGANTFSLTGSVGNGAYDASSATCNLVDVPVAVVQALQLMVADLYENRETLIINLTPSKLRTVESLLYPHRIWGF